MDELRSQFQAIRSHYLSTSSFIRHSTFQEHQSALRTLQNELAQHNNLYLRPELNKLRLEIKQFLDQQLERKTQLNREFTQSERKIAERIFLDASGRDELTDEQIQAVICDDDRNLIIAGAGSGKTRVIDFKVRYLVHHKNIDPRKIVLLSFSKKSAADLLKKVSQNVSGVEARTIHSFASKLVDFRENKLFDEREPRQESIILKALSEALRDKATFAAFQDFYENHASPIKPMIFYESLTDLREDLKKANSRLIMGADHFAEIKAKRALRTLKGDFVRSIDERYIADFLYLNEIKYEYEKKYPHSDIAYFPDFYLSDYDVYLEHFAITKSGKPPPYFDRPDRYLESIEWKKRIHQRNHTRMIESFSYRLNQYGSAHYLQELLAQYGITVKNTQYNPEIYSQISKNFYRLFFRFYQAYKMSNYSMETIKNGPLPPGTRCFLTVFEKFIAHYEAMTKELGKIDFNDLLILAIDQVSKILKRDEIDHLIVDEFQDTSNVALRLIDELKRHNPNMSVTTVGDDWQSIYGFNESDVTILADYAKRYSGVSISYLNANFRSHDHIVKLGKRFISKNPSQIPKDVTSKNTQFGESIVDFIQFEAMESKIRQIPDHESIFVLYRYNEDCPATRGLFRQYFELDRSRKPARQKNCAKDISLMTIHASKGLEARHVFVLFPSSGHRTFPSDIEEHYVLDLFRRQSDKYPFSEERRLMYVAITRAQQNLYFVSPHSDRAPDSIFWEELRDLTKS